MSIDGGLTALGGFLYQTVGAMGIAAGAYQNISGLQLENADIETLLGFAKESVIRYEDEDQDTSIRYMLHGEQRGYILVQLSIPRSILPKLSHYQN